MVPPSGAISRVVKTLLDRYQDHAVPSMRLDRFSSLRRHIAADMHGVHCGYLVIHYTVRDKCGFQAAITSVLLSNL
nr:hypothetical protein CFP56_65918 [Quercus suber]